MDMSYLPLGKLGCGNCNDVEYYCDECTKKIYDAVNKEFAQQGHVGDAVCPEDDEDE